MLDSIVEDGKYIEPDGFLDLELAKELCVQYINLYLAANLEEKKADLLRAFFQQCVTLGMAAMPAPMPGPGMPVPQANPEPPPTSPLVPNAAPQQQAA
jgi:hypothetical protein